MKLQCENCPLQKTGVVVDATITKGATSLVITKPIVKQEFRQIPSLRKVTYNYFQKYASGIGDSKYSFCSSILCEYDEEKIAPANRRVIQRVCRNNVHRLIDEINPTLIIPLGSIATNTVYKKNVKISELRGIPQLLGTRYIFPIYDPGIVDANPRQEPTVVSDFAALHRFVESGLDIKKVGSYSYGNYSIIDDLQFLIDQNPEYVSFDTEDSGLEWWKEGFRCFTMQFSIKPNEGYMLLWDYPGTDLSINRKAELISQLTVLLNNTKVIGQNAKFDAHVMRVTTGVTYPIYADTLVMAALIDENNYQKNLDMLAKLYAPTMAGYNDIFNQEVDKSRMDLVPLDKLLPYAVGDSDCTLRVFYNLYEQLQNDPILLNYFHKLSMPGLNAFINMEKSGQLIDVNALKTFELDLRINELETRNKVFGEIPRIIKRKYADNLKLSRDALIRDWLFIHPAGKQLEPLVFTKSTKSLDEGKIPSVSIKDHLPFHIENYPFLETFIEWNKLDRMLTVSVKKLREKYIYKHKIFPSYSQSTAVTGRTSSSNPNAQNFAARGALAKSFRRIFIAPKGYLLINCDLSQAELRIAAYTSNDPVMLNTYKNDLDIHLITAASVNKISLETLLSFPKEKIKSLRQSAKGCNFGIIFGMGAKKFQRYAKTEYGVDFTLEEAEDAHNAYMNLYKGIPEWHKRMRQEVRQNAQVRSIFGRLRHLPDIYSSEKWIQSEAERQSINAPIQSAASDIGVLALARINEEIDPAYLRIQGFVHDSLIAVVPEQYAQWGITTLKHYMESTPWNLFNINMTVPIKADASIGINLGEMYEVDKNFTINTVTEKAQEIPYNNGKL